MTSPFGEKITVWGEGGAGEDTLIRNDQENTVVETGQSYVSIPYFTNIYL